MYNELIYLDIETTGLNKDSEILTIQYQNLNHDYLTILKGWDSSEERILYNFREYLINHYYHVLTGLNIDSFDIPIIRNRLNDYGMEFNHYGFTIDFKPILILMNNLEFKGWNKILNPNKQSGSIIPQLYNEKRYEEIENYIVDESKNTINGIRSIIEYFRVNKIV